MALTAKFFEAPEIVTNGGTVAMSTVLGQCASKGGESTTAPQQDQCRLLFPAGISVSLDSLSNLAL